MRMRAPLVVALTLFVVVSCDQKLVEPATDQAAQVPSFNFNNNPDGGSANIFRFEDFAFFLIFDSESPLVAVHSSTPDCGGILEPVDVQGVVENPDDPLSGQVRQLTLADPINIFIVDQSQAGTCFGFQLVASGTGKLVDTDNDFFVFLRDNKNGNAFGFSANGTLYGPGGEKAHYNGLSKITWDGNTGDRFFVNEKFNSRWVGD